jgi:hypothetical protein
VSVREGEARNKIARLEEKRVDRKDPRYATFLGRIAEAISEEQEIDALRPSVPKHARVGDTELAGKLVKHDGRRKLILDTIRIACANAESDLAQMLARRMRKPREAKKLLSNLLRAPAKIRIGASSISVDLAPAATAAEADSIALFLKEVSGLGLRLRGDPRRRGPAPTRRPASRRRRMLQRGPPRGASRRTRRRSRAEERLVDEDVRDAAVRSEGHFHVSIPARSAWHCRFARARRRSAITDGSHRSRGAAALARPTGTPPGQERARRGGRRSRRGRTALRSFGWRG